MAHFGLPGFFDQILYLRVWAQHVKKKELLKLIFHLFLFVKAKKDIIHAYKYSQVYLEG